ncbi:neutral zinc metallopeptidase [Kribbella sp. NPDC054772]
MSGNQWGPPPGQPPNSQQPPQPWQQGPGYGGQPQPGRPPGPPQGPPFQGPGQPFQGQGFQGQPFHGQQFQGPQFQGQGQGRGPGQPQFGWGAPQGGQRPPKKKGRGAAIAVFTLLGVLVVGVVGLKILSNTLKHNGDPSYAEPTTTSSYSPTTEPTTGPSSSGPTTKPTTTQSTTQAPRPTTTRSTTTTKPTTNPGPSDSDLVLKNRLYKAGAMSPVGCKESKTRPSSAAGAKANYKNLVGCLNKSWAPLVAKAGGRFRAPNVLVFSGSVETPCGTHYDTAPPFFCGTNDTIYMNLTEDVGNYNRYSQSYQKVWARMWMLHQFAHEYGHHVQNNMGILQAYARIRYERPTYAKELEDSRRLELQASCFSDIFIGSNKRTYPITGQSLFQWRWLIANTIDKGRDHGAPANHKYWAMRGWDARNPSACNTFASSSSKVQ